ncbi:thymidylate synthase [Candidatus Woesebacteria bacterium]|nr:thymidylate synthase [Candidatus Woesebacteria bacterium]
MSERLRKLKEANEVLEEANVDWQYLLLLSNLIEFGVPSADRTGIGTRKLVGQRISVNLEDGFPLLTTKDVWFHGVKEELLWMMRGKRNIAPLVRKNVGIWNEWPLKKYLKTRGRPVTPGTIQWDVEMQIFIDKIKTDDVFAKIWGDLGPVYGWQWRHKRGPDGKEVDQLSQAIEDLRKSPESRRIIVDAWSPTETHDMALPPCHMIFQFVVGGDRLNCVMAQRSADVFLGLPFNIASYALLTHLVANVVGLNPGRVVITTGDTHLYNNHIDQANLQLTRDPYPLPRLTIEGEIAGLDDIKSGQIKVIDYRHHDKIPAPIAV